MASAFESLLGNINEFILNPTILVLFAVAFLFFFWGVASFIKSTGEGGEGFDKGKKNLLYGLIGLVIMFSVYGLINLILGTFGVETPDIIKQGNSLP